MGEMFRCYLEMWCRYMYFDDWIRLDFMNNLESTESGIMCRPSWADLSIFSMARLLNRYSLGSWCYTYLVWMQVLELGVSPAVEILKPDGLGFANETPGRAGNFFDTYSVCHHYGSIEFRAVMVAVSITLKMGFRTIFVLDTHSWDRVRTKIWSKSRLQPNFEVTISHWRSIPKT